MWKVERPTITAESAFSTSISRIKDPDLKERMEAIADTIEDAAANYVLEAEDASLCNIAMSTGVDGKVTTKEMKELYDGRMAHPKGPARPLYNEILAAAEHGRCPLCGHRAASTLDHILSKARYPAFAVTPVNLVPACSDCNKTKGDTPFTEEEDQYLHPYFDNVEADLWLRAEVIHSSPPAIHFFVDAPDHWPEVLAQRVRNHFRRLGLAKLYASQAAQELVNIRHQVSSLHARAGAEAVRKLLEESHTSRSRARINSWQTAFYAALEASEWFCDGGFS
ncbi:HNH endonuclease [Rhizobium sp. BR 314]|uniref:HNH endonuclease n=1 Tax=Rhizobium sp. BR 314 TaxID=3040013 RepID=UPI0039BFA44D